MTEEEKRLEDDRLKKASWHKWGPYLSERQWGTVREDYSEDGEAWSYFSHDEARSRAYRWGEDGIAGISDDYQQLCFALALWNGNDPILKERLFGLTGKQGNHGEDVKEYSFYVDNVPSHSYMKYLYKYPQKAYPYEELVEVNGKRSRLEPEYELLDTGIFNDNRYFDVFVEYAKGAPEDLAIRITIANRGPDAADIQVLPTLWFRNTWSWTKGAKKPTLALEGKTAIKANHPDLGDYWLYAENPESILFTENETNQEKLFGAPNDSAYVKDAFHEYVIAGRKEAVNFQMGTKATPRYVLKIGAGQSATLKLRLSSSKASAPFGADFDALFAKRIAEADAFYKMVTPHPLSDDMRRVQRQAYAGLLWNKQTYHYVVEEWLNGDSGEPPPPESRKMGRNANWKNLYASDVFSMPDKWEYPWFAAWDLAFHTVTLALIDPAFSKRQLLLLTREWYMRLDGQFPAYEWDFSDVNPPVHAWAALRIYQIESSKYGRKDRDFLERMFQKLVINFTWWVNRKDANGKNIFEGGFLGLDNIAAFNRTTGPTPGATLEQADGTGWMAMYCLNLLQIALELAIEDPIYEDMATKFFEHFIAVADAINNIGGGEDGLWDAKNGMYYGLLTLPDGQRFKLSADTLVGIIPIFAVAASDPKVYPFPDYRRRFDWFLKNRPELVQRIVDTEKLQIDGKALLSITSPVKVRKMLEKLLDENQFLSSYGVRSVSKQLGEHPFSLKIGDQDFFLNYEPAESTTPLFGGNSNWRGPIWFPLNFLLIESLQKFHYYLGDDFKVECPANSGKQLTLWEVSMELSQRLVNIFLKDKKGRRPVYGGIDKFQNDPNWKDFILFHEYFHGDNGAGLGASNQTGWTGLTAYLIHVLAEHKSSTAEQRETGNL